jgi:hypothetical protein
MLVLPQWLEPGGQYQPGSMYAEDVRFVVRAAQPGVQAWEVTTTGIHPYLLRTRGVSGGEEVQLQRLDQFAAIVLTNDVALIDELKRETAAIRQAAGESWVALARAKLNRVQRVHAELQELSPKKIKNADFVLAEATRDLRSAEAALARGDCDGARVSGSRVLRLTRQVQRAHWEQAARLMASPVSTPYTVSFQTLPDFWRLMQDIGRARPGEENLLPGGDFEEWGTIIGSAWGREVARENPVFSVAVELHPDGASGRALRLAAKATEPESPPITVPETPVRFVTPPMPVFSGQTVHISGKVWIETPVTAHPDGFMLYDNLSGPVGALRWRDDAPVRKWLPFELLRPVQHSGELQLTIELLGLGDVRLDELKVTTLTPQ